MKKYAWTLLFIIPFITGAQMGNLDVKNIIKSSAESRILFDADGDGSPEATMDSVGIIPKYTQADPCTGASEGTVFWNDISKYLCVCDGSNDVQVSDGTTACY